MPSTLRRAAALCGTLLSLLAPAARAQAVAAADSGMLIVFERDQPVARENYTLQPMGDSLVITAFHQRQFQDDKGARHRFTKSLLLVVDSRDFGLMRYVSVQEFQGHSVTHGLVPSDTSMAYYRELDGGGDADQVVRPPGRLFVMDSQLFTLFDVLCRSLAGKTFETRPVQLLALLPDTLATPLGKVTMARPDTLRSGTHRMPLRHYVLEDESATFDLWADRVGRLVKLEHAASGVRVERDLPVPAPARAPVRGKTGSRR